MLKCGTNTGLAGFAAPDANGRWEGFDVAVCRALAAAVLGDPEKVEFTPHHRRDPLHRAGLRRDRRAGPQLHLDLQPRRRPEVHLRRRQLLRRPGLHGVEGPRRHLGQGARRRHGLHPDRHHHRAQPRRLLQDEQHHLPAGADPDERRGRPAVPWPAPATPTPPTPRASRPAAPPTRIRRTGSSCRRSSPRSRSGRWCARATTSGPTSSAGP